MSECGDKDRVDFCEKGEKSQDSAESPLQSVDNPKDVVEHIRLRGPTTSLEEDDAKLSSDGAKRPIDVETKRDPITWDIESALHRLVHESNTPMEFLSDRTSVSFRVGDAGDASVIAKCYQEVASDKEGTLGGGISALEDDDGTGENLKNDSLELWLENGLGDEGRPPCVFALLADVYVTSEQESRLLGAVALLTVAWEHSQRLLRVEWFHVDSTLADGDILGRRLWLRLSALALMTACQVLVVDSENVTRFNCTNDA